MIIPIVIISIVLITLDVLNVGSKPIPIGFNIALQFLFITIFILFYKLNITITKEFISLKFGIGLIKKQIKISDIDKDKIEESYIPWCYGMGIRVLKNGKIYNTSFGGGIKLQIRDRVVIIGTRNSLKIKKIITNL